MFDGVCKSRKQIMTKYFYKVLFHILSLCEIIINNCWGFFVHEPAQVDLEVVLMKKNQTKTLTSKIHKTL